MYITQNIIIVFLFLLNYTTEENLTLEDIESVICNVPRTTAASAINKKSRVSGTKQCLEQPTICPTSDAASSNRKSFIQRKQYERNLWKYIT